MHFVCLKKINNENGEMEMTKIRQKLLLLRLRFDYLTTERPVG